MAAGNIKIQANDTRIYTLTPEDGASSNVAITLPKEGGMLTVDTEVVHKTGDETIAGVKTFSSSPIVPTPTTDFQVATKKYTDTRVSEVVGQLSTDYYQGPYGISWDYATDTYIRTGAKGFTAIQSLMKRCVVKADGTVNYYLNPDNSNFKEDGTPSILTGADGNVMVEIPKHYIKVKTVGNPINEVPSYFIFRKDSGDLKNKIDKALLSMKKDGTLGKISKKWFNEDFTK